MPTGTVKVYSKGRGSGWIMPDSGGERVYVHKTGIEHNDATTAPMLEKGQRVEFQIGQRPKGPAAINVQPSDVPAPDRSRPAEDDAASA
ncbi:MAG: cold-shock protein [Thermomicrobiales bacterium]